MSYEELKVEADKLGYNLKMKKKLITVLFSCFIAFSLTACGEPVSMNINIQNDSELHNTVVGKSAMVELGNGLCYDSTTRIVYWWNGSLGMTDTGNGISRYDTTPSPYLAPNGLPYKYNPETNAFEEISWRQK